MIFSGWLDVTKRLQRERYGNVPEELEGSAYAEYLRLNLCAATVELGEYAQTRNWKPYKVEGRDEERRAEAIEEIVDVLHHIANLLVLERVDDRELSEAYLNKVEKNRSRADHKAHGKGVTVQDVTREDPALDKFKQIADRTPEDKKRPGTAWALRDTKGLE